MHTSSLVLKARGKVYQKRKGRLSVVRRAAGGLSDRFSFRQESLPVFDQLEETEKKQVGELNWVCLEFLKSAAAKTNFRISVVDSPDVETEAKTPGT